ncbi:MAG: uncharacterized protein KVP18_002243 [Porospora cf. gigantea A]|uniref:uncharacterized protein n=1 Tax=Porospora cf. gigantea A TaxID=2853593 RepID=UPI00355A4B63|nr:MAG: hypothetical protein KVP18_002243 [Porospora cf. gigantea A]
MEALLTIRSGTPSQREGAYLTHIVLMRLMMLCALPSLTSGFYFQAINGLWQICETRDCLITGYLDKKGMNGIVVLEVLITVGSILGTLCFGFLPISVHRMTLISA